MGRQGGPSLRERAIEQSKHAAKMKRKRGMRGPFMCPRCAGEKQFVIRPVIDPSTRKPVLNSFLGRCAQCGLSLGPVEGPEPIDAYCRLCDEWRATL